MASAPSQAAIEGMFQDLGELATDISMELGNGELFIRDDNARDLYALFAEASTFFDKLKDWKDSASFAPPPLERDSAPIYGVTNGRGRIIA